MIKTPVYSTPHSRTDLRKKLELQNGLTDDLLEKSTIFGGFALQRFHFGYQRNSVKRAQMPHTVLCKANSYSWNVYIKVKDARLLWESVKRLNAGITLVTLFLYPRLIQSYLQIYSIKTFVHD